MIIFSGEKVCFFDYQLEEKILPIAFAEIKNHDFNGKDYNVFHKLRPFEGSTNLIWYRSYDIEAAMNNKWYLNIGLFVFEL